MKQKDRSKQRGSAMLETALTLLAFVMVLIAIFDVGQVLFFHQSLVERVRGALRYGSVNAYDAAAIQNMVLYGQPSAPEGGAAFYRLTREMVRVSRMDANSAEDRILVTVADYPVEFVSPFLPRRTTGVTISHALTYEGP